MSSAALSFLDRMPPEVLDWVVSNSTMRTVLANGILVNEGDHVYNISFVSVGLFEVTIATADGGQQKIAQFGPGALIGEMSWLEGKPASATIRAVESSAILVLDGNILDKKISADSLFAAYFYRGLAREASARLRGTNSLLSKASRAEENHSATAPQVGIAEKLQSFKQLAVATDKASREKKNAGTNDREQQLMSALSDLAEDIRNLFLPSSPIPEQQRPMLAAIAQQEFLPFMHLSDFWWRTYAKPRGYAGDYGTIELIYDNEPSGQGVIGPIMDRWGLDQAPSQAVRNRRGLMAGQIKLTQKSVTNRPARILSLACGPAREIFDAFCDLQPDSLEVTALDIDQEALALVKKKAEEKNLTGQITCAQANLIYLATGRQTLELVPQDFIYSIGLIDYFNDQFVIRLIDWVYDRLAPGGRVMLGNFHPRNPFKVFMDHILEWQLIHRDEAQMNELFQRSKFKRSCTNILFEDSGINLFAECVKT